MIIQNQIEVSDEWVNNIIKGYEKMNDKFRIMFRDFYGGKKEIIEAIKNKTEDGKFILMSNYNFEKWKDSPQNTPLWMSQGEELKRGKISKNLATNHFAVNPPAGDKLLCKKCHHVLKDHYYELKYHEYHCPVKGCYCIIQNKENQHPAFLHVEGISYPNPEYVKRRRK